MSRIAETRAYKRDLFSFPWTWMPSGTRSSMKCLNVVIVVASVTFSSACAPPPVDTSGFISCGPPVEISVRGEPNAVIVSWTAFEAPGHVYEVEWQPRVDATFVKVASTTELSARISEETLAAKQGILYGGEKSVYTHPTRFRVGTAYRCPSPEVEMTLCSAIGCFREVDSAPVNPSAMASRGDLAVSVGLGNIWSSNDGLVWQHQAIGSMNLRKVFVGASGSFVAYGDDHLLVSTDDAKTWQQVAKPNVGSITSVVYDGAYYAFGNLRTATSNDLGTWTYSKYVGNSRPFGKIARGNGVWLVAQQGVFRSTDGVSWSVLPTMVSSYDIVFAKGRFVAAGDDGKLRTSTDGLQWELSDRGAGTSVTFLNQRFVAFDGYPCGMARVCDLGVIYLSDDGKTWERDANLLEFVHFSSPIFVAGKYVFFVSAARTPYFVWVIDAS